MLDWLTYEGLTLQQFFNPDVLEWKRPPSIMVVHSTEGAGFPSISTYGNGRKAPHFTCDPRLRQTRQHYPLTQAAWALVAPADGTHTNTGGAIQIEIVGTCDPRRTDLPSVLDLDDGALGYLMNARKLDPSNPAILDAINQLGILFQSNAQRAIRENRLDDANRWLGTASETLDRVPADSTVPFAIPVADPMARGLRRYSLYAGLEPNPLAPGR